MEEKDLKRLIKQSKLEMQFPDFEENVMEAVRQKEASEKSVWKNIRWSWFFFIIGLVLGMAATYILANSQLQYFGKNSDFVLLAIEIFIILIVSTQFDNLIRITFKK